MGFMVNVLLHIKFFIFIPKKNLILCFSFIYMAIHVPSNNVSNLSILQKTRTYQPDVVFGLSKILKYDTEKKISILLTNLDPGSCRCVSGGWGFRTSEKGISALKRICISRKTILEVFRKEGFLAFIILVLPMQMPEVYKDKGIFC